MRKVLAYIALGLLVLGCGSIKQVPVEHQVIYNYVDSLRIKDSTVVIPVERIVDVARDYDTLRMETSKAKAEAYVDTSLHMLRGSIENKAGTEYKYIYQDRIVYRDSIVTKEVPVEVEVEKTVHPKYEKWLWVWLVLSVSAAGIWIFFKLKS